jgi:hypothetical protein
MLYGAKTTKITCRAFVGNLFKNGSVQCIVLTTSLEFEFSDGLQGLRSVRKRRFVRDKLPESEILDPRRYRLQAWLRIQG